LAPRIQRRDDGLDGVPALQLDDLAAPLAKEGREAIRIEHVEQLGLEADGTMAANERRREKRAAPRDLLGSGSPLLLHGIQLLGERQDLRVGLERGDEECTAGPLDEQDDEGRG